jgi:hypothetical protein
LAVSFSIDHTAVECSDGKYPCSRILYKDGRDYSPSLPVDPETLDPVEKVPPRGRV